MSDAPDLSLVPEPEGTTLVPKAFVAPFSDPEFAAEAGRKKAQVYKEKRKEHQARARERASLVSGAATADAADAAESAAFKDKTNEDLADMIVRRMAKVVILGGEAFMPTTAKEATDMAHAWGMVAKNEATRKGKVKEDVPEDDTPARKAMHELEKLGRRLAAVQQQKKSAG